MTAKRKGWLRAMLGLRCPRCREGRIFARSGTMNASCPVCGLVFEREEGYFLGAMYISYGLSVGFLALGTYLLSLVFPEWELTVVCLLAIVVYVPLVPLVFRYSRTVWIYFDRWAWPDRPQGLQ